MLFMLHAVLKLSLSKLGVVIRPAVDEAAAGAVKTKCRHDIICAIADITLKDVAEPLRRTIHLGGEGSPLTTSTQFVVKKYPERSSVQVKGPGSQLIRIVLLTNSTGRD